MQFRWTFAWFEEIASDWFVDEICLGPEISAFGTHVCVTLAFRDLVCAILSRPSKDFSSDKRNSKGLQVEEVGSAVTSIKPGQFVIGSFFASDNTCPNCQVGYQSSCQHAEFIGTAQAPLLRVPLADGTLVATPDVPSNDMVPSLLALSDVMGTGWFAAHAANVKPGNTVVVVGDGAVGLLGVLSAEHMGRQADHRDEPSRFAAEARPRIRCDRHRDRAR